MPAKMYAPGAEVPGFKPSQDMSIGMNSKEKVKYGTATVTVSCHVTLTMKSGGGRGLKGAMRQIDHFHVTFETDTEGKLGQYNHAVNNGSIGAGKWGGNNVDIPDEVMTALQKIDEKKSSAMKKLVAA